MPNYKDMRKQLKNVIETEAANLFTKELYDHAFASLKAEITTRLQAIETDIKDKLNQLDARQLDMQSYIVRELTKAAPLDPIKK